MPHTMRAYAMRGTPTTLLIDTEGRLRPHILGHIPDLKVAAEIVALMNERPLDPAASGDQHPDACTPGGCS
jgi:hypothetical protein